MPLFFSISTYTLILYSYSILLEKSTILFLIYIVFFYNLC